MNGIRKKISSHQVKFLCFIMLSAMVLGTGACGRGEDAEAAADTVMGSGESVVIEELLVSEEMFTQRDLEGTFEKENCVEILMSDEGVQCDSPSVQTSEGIVVIGKEGVYRLQGSWQNGMIEVAAGETDKVQLVLDGISVSNPEGAAIYVKSADKVFLTLAEGSVNVLSGGRSIVLDDSNVDGAVFAKSDLTVNGTGKLEVTSEEGHGIVCKDDLKVTGGELTVTAARQGLSGKNSFRMAGGTVRIVSGGDGIHSEHEDAKKGYVYIAEGDVHITSDGDGISASGFLQIENGTFCITSGGGYGNPVVEKDETGDDVSTKGLKSGLTLTVSGGEFEIDAQDDSLHSNGDVTLADGALLLATGDDGVHADETVTVAGGTLEITASYEGIEGKNVVISGGEIKVRSSDDGINGAGGRDQSGFGGFRGGDGFGSGNDYSILISGGRILVNADGDGIDSNGSLTVSGGEIYVSGPTDSANGAIDYESTGQITGGKVVAVGSAGMAQNFGDTSTQGTVMLSVAPQSAGSEVVVRDAEGTELLRYAPDKDYSSVVVSCPEMVQGGSYVITAGDSETEVTLENLVYGSGFGGGMRNPFGGHGGERPGEPPEGWNGENPVEPPEGWNGENPMNLPEGRNGENPMNLPEGRNGENPVDLPEGQGRENPMDLPEGRNGENPVDMPEGRSEGMPVGHQEGETRGSAGELPENDTEDL